MGRAATKKTPRHQRWRALAGQDRVDVRLRTTHGQTATSDRVRSAHLGAIFVETETPWPFGTEMKLEIELPDGTPGVSCKGFVAWATHEPEGRNPGGMGIRLMDLSIADMRRIAELTPAADRGR